MCKVEKRKQRKFVKSYYKKIYLNKLLFRRDFEDGFCTSCIKVYNEDEEEFFWEECPFLIDTYSYEGDLEGCVCNREEHKVFSKNEIKKYGFDCKFIREIHRNFEKIYPLSKNRSEYQGRKNKRITYNDLKYGWGIPREEKISKKLFYAFIEDF